MTLEEIKKSITDKIVGETRCCQMCGRHCRQYDPLALPHVPNGAKIIKAKIGKLTSADIDDLQNECDAWNDKEGLARKRERCVIWMTGVEYECAGEETGRPDSNYEMFNAIVIETKRGCSGGHRVEEYENGTEEISQFGMTITEYIQALQSLKEKYGDLPVAIDHLDDFPDIRNEIVIKYHERGALGKNGRTWVPSIVIS